MPTLPTDTNSTPNYTPAEHANHHNVIHAVNNVLDTKGDIPVATAADTWDKLPVGSNGQVLTADSTQATGLKWAPAASTWVQAINESGASIANWTAVSGTWSTDGTVINQTVTDAAVRNLTYNILHPTVIAGVQVDVRVRSGTGSTQRAGFSFGIVSGSALVYIAASASAASYTINLEAEGATLIKADTVSGSGYDVWFSLQALETAAGVSYWVNGTLIATGRPGSNATGLGDNIDISKFALYTYQASASFRNIKVWRHSLPWE